MTDAPDLKDPATVAQLAATFRGAAMADAEIWARSCLVWKDAFGVEHVGLKNPSEVQLLMFEHDRQCKFAGVPCKLITYKSRRMGASTGAQGIVYHREQKTGGLTAKLMANTDKTSGEVSDIFKLMAKKDRFPWPGMKGPPVVQDVAGRTTLASGSVYVDLSARGVDPGRGGAAQIANLTECAHYSETDDPIGAFLPSVQAAMTSSVGLLIADSTPNGPQGWFYDMCMLALKREAEGKQTLNDWKLIFVPWWKGWDASKPFASEQEKKDFMATLNADEVEEYENHDPDRKVITPENLNWRRMIINDVLKGSVEKFREEYASSVREGFMRSARHCFNVRRMQAGYEAAKGCKTIKLGGMSLLDGNEKAVFVSDEMGATKIWEDPRYGLSYLVSWDTMTGADQASGGKANPDWHAIQVWRAEYSENGVVYVPRMVAEHCSRLPIEVAAAEAHGLSLYYGGALIFAEVNNSGLAGVKALEGLGASIFARKMANVTLNNTESANGWMTTEVTRKTIISFMAQAIRTGAIDVPSAEFWEECLSFVIDPKRGRPEAMRGQHDDRVLSGAIAISNMNAATMMEFQRRPKISESQLRRNGGRVLPDGTRLESYNRDARR